MEYNHLPDCKHPHAPIDVCGCEVKILQAKVEELEAENKNLAIQLGQTREAFTEFRGSAAGKTCMMCTLRERADCYENTERLEARVEELENWINIAGGIKCPACDDVGWYPVQRNWAQPEGEQEQCQFCYECPDSLFNRKGGK